MSDFSEILKNAQNACGTQQDSQKVIAEFESIVSSEDWLGLRLWASKLDDFGKRVLADYGKENKMFMVVK